VVSANHTFSWTVVGDADKYEIWVQRDSDNAVFTRNNITGTSFQFGLPLLAGGYRVWLRAVSLVGERSAWSAPVRFRVASSDTPAPGKAVGDVMLAALEVPLLNPEFATSTDRQQKRTATPVRPAAEAVRELPVEAAAVASAVIRDVDAVMETWNSAEWWLELPAASPVTVPTESGEMPDAASEA
jgi:predicted phage tail protein